MASTFYPFDVETVQKIDTAFDVKEIFSQNLGEPEVVFVPKEGVSSQTKEAGLTALTSLMAHENPDIVENDNKTGVEQASNSSFPEFYQGTDTGRADVAREIASMMVNLHNVAEISKVYGYDTTDKGGIVFTPIGNVDPAPVNKILRSHFNMVPVQLGDYAEGLSPVVGQQDRVVEFMTGKAPERKSKGQSEMEAYWDKMFNTEEGQDEVNTLANELNSAFNVLGEMLVAKEGVTEDNIRSAEDKVDAFFQTEEIFKDGKIVGLKALPGEEGRAAAIYQAMRVAKEAEEFRKYGPKALENPDVRTMVQETLNEQPTATDGSVARRIEPATRIQDRPVTNVMPTPQNTTANDGTGITAEPVMGVRAGAMPAPTGAIPTENVPDEPNAFDFFAEYMGNQDEDRVNTSDENEVMFNAMRYMAMRQTGEKIPDILSLNHGERGQALDRAISGLGGKKFKEYQGHLETAKVEMLSVLPPKKLAILSVSLDAKMGKTKEGTPEFDALSIQQANVDNCIDTIIKEYVNGDVIINQDNIADVYEGMMALLFTRDSRNKTVQTANQMLQVEINKYDDDNNLTGLTSKDDKALTNRFESLVGKMDINDFDIKKISGLLSGIPVASETVAQLSALQFTDEKGNLIPQTQKDANGNEAVIGGSELDILYQISTADTIKTLVTEKGDLTPETLSQTFNDALKNNLANVLIADLIAHGTEPTRDLITKTLAGMAQGTPYKADKAVITGFTAGHNNGYMGFVNRLATKVGKDSVIAKKLFKPIKGLDQLAEKRFGPLYGKAKRLAKVLSGNTSRAVLMGTVSQFSWGVGGPMAAVGVSAAMTAVCYWKLRRAEVKQAKAQDKPVPSFGNFLKRNITGMAMSTVSMTARAVGLPVVNMAVAGANISRSVFSTFRQSRKAGYTGWQSLRRSMTGIMPTALTMIVMAFAGESIDNAAHATTDMVTNTIAPIMDATPPVEVTPTPETTPTPEAAVTPKDPIVITEEDLANHVVNGEPLPGIAPQEFIPQAGEVPETNASMQTPANPENGAVGAEIMPDEPAVHHVYTQDAHDLAHARLHGEGVYDATGHHTVPQNFSDAQLNQALSTMKDVTYGHAELQGIGGQSNDEILLYKLVQADKLTGSDMDLQNGQEVGQYLGARDSAGNLHTPHSLLNDLMNGRPVDSEVAAQILGKVENSISAEGHFLEDIKNFKEAGTWSYRPGGNPGWAEACDAPAPTPIPTPELTPVPTPELTPVPTPVPDIAKSDVVDVVTPDIVTPDFVSANELDKMLYFIPADELWKAPTMEDRIGALPKPPKGKEDVKLEGIPGKPQEVKLEGVPGKPQEVKLEGVPGKPQEVKLEGVPGKPQEVKLEGVPGKPQEVKLEGVPGKPQEVKNTKKVGIDVTVDDKKADGNGAFTFKMGDKAPAKPEPVKDVKKVGIDFTVDGQKAGTNGSFTFKMGDKAPDQKSATEMIEKLRARGTEEIKPDVPKTPETKVAEKVNPSIIREFHKMGDREDFATPMSKKQANAIDNGKPTAPVKEAPKTPETKVAEKVNPSIIREFHKMGDREDFATPMSKKQADAINNAVPKAPVKEAPKGINNADHKIIQSFHNHKNGER